MARFTPRTWQTARPGRPAPKCSGCGRRVQPFELIDISGVANAAIPGSWACTSCANEAVRQKVIAKPDLIAGLKTAPKNRREKRLFNTGERP